MHGGMSASGNPHGGLYACSLSSPQWRKAKTRGVLPLARDGHTAFCLGDAPMFGVVQRGIAQPTDWIYRNCDGVA